jgi:hypothetical protein
MFALKLLRSTKLGSRQNPVHVCKYRFDMVGDEGDYHAEHTDNIMRVVCYPTTRTTCFYVGEVGMELNTRVT